MAPKLSPEPWALSPLVVIVGETASGKSALALELAKRHNGEIIAADSRTVYRGMDIGTAKPTKEEQAQIPHHLIDVVKPDEPFNVVNFQGRTLETIKNIGQRGKLPILVGGTGLYVDSVIFNYLFGDSNSERDPINPRHAKPSDKPKDNVLRSNTLVIGLSVERDVLKERISKRVDKMVDDGFVAEVQTLAEKYGWDAPGLLAPGYRAFRKYIEGSIKLDEAKAQFVLNDLNLAKRQRSWFKRNKHINWVNSPEAAQEIVMTFLQQNK